MLASRCLSGVYVRLHYAGGIVFASFLQRFWEEAVRPFFGRRSSDARRRRVDGDISRPLIVRNLSPISKP